MNATYLNVFLLNPDLSTTASADHVRVWLEYTKGDGVKDPDASDDCRKFYQLMWCELLHETGMELRPKPRCFSGEPSKDVQGDFMCSVATVFRKGLVLFLNEHVELRDVFPDGIGGKRTYPRILLEDMQGDQRFQAFWGNESLQRFIKAAYTPANLIIVPDGFNCARYNKTKDFWDETLRLYFEKYDVTKPLKHKPPKSGQTYNVGTPFYQLVQASVKSNDALCLGDWLDESDHAIMLPTKEPAALEDWCRLLDEMTRRINSRRHRLQDRHTASQDE